MKKIGLLISAILIFTFSFAGCASTKNTGTTQASSDNLLAKIKKDGKIKIGTEGTYAPYTFHDKNGKLTGFDVEISEEVAKRLGVKAEFIETKWDGMFAGLNSKRFDAVANEVTINDERKQKYDFSDSYIVSRAVLIVSNDNNSITKFEDLKGKKAAESLTSSGEKVAKSYGAEIVVDDGFNQAIDLITSKRADAVVNDSLSFLDYKKQKPDTPIKVVAKSEKPDVNAFVFNKGNKELLDAVNKAISDMKADGTYLKISKKWFNEDVSK